MYNQVLRKDRSNSSVHRRKKTKFKLSEKKRRRNNQRDFSKHVTFNLKLSKDRRVSRKKIRDKKLEN